jgi:hypothetical protein
MTITTEWLGTIIATTAVTVGTTVVVTNLFRKRNGNDGATARLTATVAEKTAERVAELAEASTRSLEAKLDSQSATLNHLCENLKPLESLPDSQNRMIELLGRIEGLLQRR